MKNDTIQTRNRITKCLWAFLAFCFVLMAPIEAEAAAAEAETV